MTKSLETSLRAELTRAADPARAPGMQAYMKSAMPYLGVPTPAMRAACKRVYNGLEFSDAAAWREAALSLWRAARYREERYAAIELTGLRIARGYQTMAALPMYEEMIVTGAWWDYVDSIAANRLILILDSSPGPMRASMIAWSRSDDLWKRRSSILCQLTRKGATDLDLLYTCIEPSLGSSEFFLRKAIGWALRQLAWTNPDEVVRYVRAQKSVLSPLSKREALKNVIRAGILSELP